MNHILNIEEQKVELYKIFSKIYEGNSLLFLGAGASIGEKKFLSKEIIDLYEEYLGKEINERDITSFVDILSADPNFSRNHFDNEVEKMLKKLKHTDEHKILVSLPWRQIITTNFDLLIEQACDDNLKSSQESAYKIITIREKNSLNYFEGNDEIKYIKLNGCISDKGRYPLAFSTSDFNNLKKYYKVVLSNLKNLSNKISFLTIGYSFNDDFGKKLLDSFDSHNFRDKKWIINIDPYPKENALPYYSQKRICIVKISFKDFFNEYKLWETHNAKQITKKRKISITDSKNNYQYIPPQLLLKLDGAIKQLNNQYSSSFIKPLDFYKGEEPNYNVINRDIDVFQRDKISKIKENIQKVTSNSNGTLIPLFFLKGEFGIGKSTFTLRLIHELAKDVNLDLVAFEIVDFLSLRIESVVSLFSKIKAKNIILYCDDVEIDTTFKELINLRRELSIEQFNEVNLFFIIPIRENILERYKKDRDIKELYELTLNGKLAEEEIIELLEKFKDVNLVNYRDIEERDLIIEKVKRDFDSDSFVSFLSIVSDGRHQNDLLQAYNELSQEAQKAFLYTALLHRYKMPLPASLLKQIISMDWDEFTEKVIKVEGKGILTNEEITTYGVDTDIYFRTKHPIIAETLVSILYSKDSQYNFYKRIINSIFLGKRNSYLIINLLKVLRSNSVFSETKLNKLFDLAYKNLSEDPFFLLSYAINLQYRKTINDLKKGLSYLVYAEGLLEKRNHRFIHRKAVINFDLAKLHYNKEKELNFTYTYLKEAKEFFKIKLIYDPFSAYSYSDYIKLLIWEIKKLQLSQEEELRKKVKIDELFEIAFASVTERTSWLSNLQLEYTQEFKKTANSIEYKNYLDDLYSQTIFRPYACILLYNFHFEQKSDDSYTKCNSLLQEMNHHLDNNEVIKFLFKYYGHNLHLEKNRNSLSNLSRNYPFLKEDFPLRYYYYNFIAKSYNHDFYHGKQELSEIKYRFYGINPEFSFTWCDGDGETEILIGIIIKKENKKYKAVKIPSLQQTFRLAKGNYDKYKANTEVKVILKFYLYGIIAEIQE